MTNKLDNKTEYRVNNNHLSGYPTPMDLSRRRDSVETRKTPSPYNSSSFGSSPPSVANDSPSTTSVTSLSNASSLLHNMRNRSDTPTHHYQPTTPTGYCAMPSAYPPMFYPFQSKRDSPSPPSDDALRAHLHQLEFAKKSSLLGQAPEELNAYLMQAVALQQKLVAQSHQMAVRSDSDESSESLPNVTALSPTMHKPQSPSSTYPMIVGRDGKLARPFKAYPRNPLNVTASFSATDAIIDRNSADKYQMFRKEMLEQIHAANGGQPTVSNPKMRRTSSKSFADSVDQKQHSHQDQQNNNVDHHSHRDGSPIASGGSQKDSSYFERRKKNNAAAKKSRDRRRIKEDEIAIRAAFLERENIELKFEMAALKRQLAQFVNT